MSVAHIVLFQLKPGSDASAIDDFCARTLALKDKCLHPKTNKPYMRSSSGGKDNSTEGKQDGFTHAFLMHFDNVADRDYYAHEDPAHLEFVTAAKSIVIKAVVVDFTPGRF